MSVDYYVDIGLNTAAVALGIFLFFVIAWLLANILRSVFRALK